MMELIIWLLSLLLAAFMGVRTVPADMPVQPVTPTPLTVIPGENDEPMMIMPLVIEQVEVQVLESFPMQLVVNVSGYQQDGCEYPITVTQQNDGSTITIAIERMLPLAVMCPAVIIPYENSIAIEGGFEGGTYTIDVNGVITVIEL